MLYLFYIILIRADLAQYEIFAMKFAISCKRVRLRTNSFKRGLHLATILEQNLCLEGDELVELSKAA